MGSRMELFEQIRRDRARDGLSTRGLAVKHGVHRRAVRQALASPVPPVKRPPAKRPSPKLGAYHALIDGWLEADRDAPRKQRHTARRVWKRLVEEQAQASTTISSALRSKLAEWSGLGQWLDERELRFGERIVERSRVLRRVDNCRGPFALSGWFSLSAAGFTHDFLGHRRPTHGCRVARGRAILMSVDPM